MLQFQAWLVTASGRGQSSAAWLSCLCHRLGLGVVAGGACFGTKVRRHVCVYRQGHLSLDGTGSSKETNFRSGCGWTAQQRLSKGACLSCFALVRLCFQVINGAIPFLDITSPSIRQKEVPQPRIPRLLFRRQARPEAAKLGLAAPVNETVARLLRAREMAFQP